MSVIYGLCIIDVGDRTGLASVVLYITQHHSGNAVQSYHLIHPYL